MTTHTIPKHCPYCLAAVEAADRFCPACGGMIEEVERIYGVRRDGSPATFGERLVAKVQGDERKPLVGTIQSSPVAPPKPIYTPEQKRSDLKNVGWGIAIIVAIVIVWLANGYRDGGVNTIEGAVRLHDDDESWQGTCAGDGGFSNIYSDAQVVVLNEQSETLATGRLSSGLALNPTTCTFDFTVDEVPKADFYTIEVSGRGGPIFSYEDMEANSWQVSLSIGEQ